MGKGAGKGAQNAAMMAFMSEWGGCHLADVLAKHGVSTDPSTWDDGRHVCFRGPDKELPAGADGSYGTSLPLRYVMDKSNDVLLCWEQNGQRLQADHGFPLRIIIPGFIGGRMVKWLSTPRRPMRGLVKIDSRADRAARTLARPPYATDAYDHLQTLSYFNPTPRAPTPTPRWPRSRRPGRRRSTSPPPRCRATAR